jgi:hypothetical protein
MTTAQVDGFCYYPNAAVVMNIDPHIRASDPLRELLVDCFIHKGSSRWIGEKHDLFSYEVCLEVMAGIFKTQDSLPDLSSVGVSKYYQDKIGAFEKWRSAHDHRY